MGLLDKVESNEKDVAKKADAKAKKVTKATPVKKKSLPQLKKRRRKRRKNRRSKNHDQLGYPQNLKSLPNLVASSVGGLISLPTSLF